MCPRWDAYATASDDCVITAREDSPAASLASRGPLLASSGRRADAQTFLNTLSVSRGTMPTSELGIPQGLTQEKRKTEAKVAAPAGGVWEAVGYLVRSSTVWDGGDGGGTGGCLTH